MTGKPYHKGVKPKKTKQSRTYMTAAIVENSRISLRDEPIDQKNPSATDVKVSIQATKILSTNVGWEIVNIGLKKERIYNSELLKKTNEATEIQQTIQKLIELNGQLSISEKDVVLSDKTIALFKELEKAKITIVQPADKKISPARMAEIKAQIGAHNDRLKTELQTLFTTKIQVMINELNSLLDTLRTIQKAFDRFMENIISAMKK